MFSQAAQAALAAATSANPGSPNTTQIASQAAAALASTTLAAFGGGPAAAAASLAVSGAATTTPRGEAAVDQALASPEVNLDDVKEKVERDPSLWRREGESFHEWVKRIGLFSLTEDVHESRKFQMRAAYTDRVISRSRERTEHTSEHADHEAHELANKHNIDLTTAKTVVSQVDKAYAIHQRAPLARHEALPAQDPRLEKFLDKPPQTPLPLTGKRSEVMLGVPIRVGR